MKHRLATVGALVALVALAISIISPAGADRRFEEKTLRFAEKAADDDQFETEIDVGEAGFSVGDYLVFEGEPIYNRALTKQVGVIRGDCLVVEVVGEQESTSECDITVDLDKGLITVEGTVAFSDPFDPVQEFAVTGGTGAFKTAHGELKLDFSRASGIRLTFKLLL